MNKIKPLINIEIDRLINN